MSLRRLGHERGAAALTRKRRRAAIDVGTRCDGPVPGICRAPRASVRAYSVRNIKVQAEMSGQASIQVGEVSGSITVASMSGNAKIEAGSCGKPTTKTGTITGSAAITGTGC